MSYVSKPGLVWRALAAFILLNLPLILTIGFVWYLAGGDHAEWWVKGILAIGTAACELGIVAGTIADPLHKWIKSEEYITDGQKPSWEKK